MDKHFYNLLLHASVLATCLVVCTACPPPPGDDSYLDVSIDNIRFPAEASSKKVVVITEQEWQASCSESYHFDVSPQNGVGPALLYIDANDNNSLSARKGVISIRGLHNGMERHVLVEQEAAQRHLSLRPDSIVLSPEKGDRVMFIIDTNCEWRIDEVPSFVTVTPTAGNEYSYVYVATNDENTNGGKMRGYITVTGEEIGKASILVVQNHK